MVLLFEDWTNANTCAAENALMCFPLSPSNPELLQKSIGLGFGFGTATENHPSGHRTMPLPELPELPSPFWGGGRKPQPLPQRGYAVKQTAPVLLCRVSDSGYPLNDMNVLLGRRSFPGG